MANPSAVIWAIINDLLTQVSKVSAHVGRQSIAKLVIPLREFRHHFDHCYTLYNSMHHMYNWQPY